MNRATLEWYELLARGLVWAAGIVLLLSIVAAVVIAGSDNAIPLFPDAERQGRGIAALASLGGGLTSAGLLGGLGAILRLMVAERLEKLGPVLERVDPVEPAEAKATRPAPSKEAREAQPPAGETRKPAERATKKKPAERVERRSRPATRNERAVAAPAARRAQGCRGSRHRQHAAELRARGRDRRRHGRVRRPRPRDGSPARPVKERSPLVVAHDWEDAARARDDARRRARRLHPPTARPGRDRLRPEARRPRGGARRGAAGARADRAGDGLDMYTESLAAIRAIEPGPPPRLDISARHQGLGPNRLARPAVLAALALMRRRLPGLARRRAPEIGAAAIWVYHALASPGLVEVTRELGIELICWTVDDPAASPSSEDGSRRHLSNDPARSRALGS